MSDQSGEVVIVADEFGLLVQGPTDVAASVIDHLIDEAGPGRASVSRLPWADAAAVGAAGAAAVATSGEYLRLTADGLAKVKAFGPEFDAGGALRGWVRDGSGFAGQLTFEPVSLAAEQALALQTAAMSLALRSAIANVQKAVERVEDKVDAIKDHLDSRLRGDVVGTYRHLKRVVDATNARGRLLQADWDSVAGIRSQLSRDLETLRAFVEARAGKLTLDDSVRRRQDTLRRFHSERGNVADVLSLILVAEQSLHLYEYLRIQQVRNRELEYVNAALADARAALQAQVEEDRRLVKTLHEAIERVRVIGPLEVHHVLTRRDLDRHARILDLKVREFAAASRAPGPDKLARMEVASLAETREEVRQRALDAGHAARVLGTSAARAASKGAKRLGAKVTDKSRRRG